ncbi:hypothetical protein EVAR_52319_1 [Eumeta japonica]|uniref:Uncharacterized protein n=1 Tax=Eumeta variegata TaxID=151549 RepID=A0A4C1Y467_EUMVA|nr:hypothetical protein EVAR_52319_1 [Eumeta japonica]
MQPYRSTTSPVSKDTTVTSTLIVREIIVEPEPTPPYVNSNEHAWKMGVFFSQENRRIVLFFILTMQHLFSPTSIWNSASKGGAIGAQAQGVDSEGRKNGQTRQDYYFFGLLLMSSRCAPSAPFQHIHTYMPVSPKMSVVVLWL